MERDIKRLLVALDASAGSGRGCSSRRHMNYSKRNNNVCTCCNRVSVESNIIISPVHGPMKYQRVKRGRGSLLTQLTIMSTKLRIIPIIMLHTDTHRIHYTGDCYIYTFFFLASINFFAIGLLSSYQKVAKRRGEIHPRV